MRKLLIVCAVVSAALLRGRIPPPSPPGPIRDHFSVANLCGYPAVSVPNGFDEKGRPTGITFLGRLYAEAEVLAVAKAYQEVARWHEQKPELLA